MPELSRIYRLPSGSFFLFGLRGVGKSTWIRQELPDAHRFDLLDEVQRLPGLIRSHPAGLVVGLPHPETDGPLRLGWLGDQLSQRLKDLAEMLVVLAEPRPDVELYLV